MENVKFEVKMRLKSNHYATRKAYNRLQKAVEMNDNTKMYCAIGEVLLWILTTEEWHKKHNIEYADVKQGDDNGVLIYGLRHAYNMVKHNMQFFLIYNKKGGFSFPTTSPIEFKEIEIHWMVAGDILEGQHPNQKKNYEKYLENEEILGTLDRAITFLNKVSRPFLLNIGR